MADPPRKQKKGKRKRLAWIRALKGHRVSVTLGDRHKFHGRDLAGYRVVRVVRALYDRKLKQVVKIVARLYGGGKGANDGWNGPKVVLDDPRTFRGGMSKGVCVGKKIVDVNEFVNAARTKKDIPYRDLMLAEAEEVLSQYRLMAKDPAFFADVQNARWTKKGRLWYGAGPGGRVFEPAADVAAAVNRRDDFVTEEPQPEDQCPPQAPEPQDEKPPARKGPRTPAAARPAKKTDAPPAPTKPRAAPIDIATEEYF